MLSNRYVAKIQPHQANDFKQFLYIKSLLTNLNSKVHAKTHFTNFISPNLLSIGLSSLFFANLIPSNIINLRLASFINIVTLHSRLSFKSSYYRVYSNYYCSTIQLFISCLCNSFLYYSFNFIFQGGLKNVCILRTNLTNKRLK